MINEKKRKQEKKLSNNKLKDFESEIKNQEELKKQIEEWKNKYLRALADYQNLEKRINYETSVSLKRSVVKLLLKFIDVLDLIERAEIFVKDQGLKLIKEKLINILKEEGIKEIEILGKIFDPNLAECVEVIDGTRDNMVVEILRKGYLLGDEVIRAARVKVEKRIKS